MSSLTDALFLLICLYISVYFCSLVGGDRLNLMFQRAEPDLWQTESFLVKPKAYLTLFTCKLTMNQSHRRIL